MNFCFNNNIIVKTGPRIKYLNENKEHYYFSDFYYEPKNLIIEIKSFWTHNEKNWKDRLKTYKKLKYKIKLVIGESRKNIKEINY